MADVRDRVIEGFRQGLDGVSDDDLMELCQGEAVERGRRAAEQLIAPITWARLIGDRRTTSEVASLLGISRQAINKRLNAGSLIGVPGPGTTLFPAWQFDAHRGTIRPEARLIANAFLEELGYNDPYTVIAWTQTPQDEDLDGMTPLEWIQKGGEHERLAESARRAAANLAA